MTTKAHLLNTASLSYPTGACLGRLVPFARLAAEVLGELNQDRVPLALIGRGASGAIVGSHITANLLSNGHEEACFKHLLKEGERSHRSSMVHERGRRTAIVDDFVNTGATLEAILKHLREVEGDPRVLNVHALVVSHIDYPASFSDRLKDIRVFFENIIIVSQNSEANTVRSIFSNNQPPQQP